MFLLVNKVYFSPALEILASSYYSPHALEPLSGLEGSKSKSSSLSYHCPHQLHRVSQGRMLTQGTCCSTTHSADFCLFFFLSFNLLFSSSNSCHYSVSKATKPGHGVGSTFSILIPALPQMA